MPWNDWQFWIVTLAGLGALIVVVRPFLPGRKRGRRVSLTVEGDGVERNRQRSDAIS